MSHNQDSTTYEENGTLTVCKCGEEFFLSFRNGFMCESCKKKLINTKITDELIEMVFNANKKRSTHDN